MSGSWQLRLIPTCLCDRKTVLLASRATFEEKRKHFLVVVVATLHRPAPLSRMQSDVPDGRVALHSPPPRVLSFETLHGRDASMDQVHTLLDTVKRRSQLYQVLFLLLSRFFFARLIRALGSHACSMAPGTIDH